jgi:phosphate ABC transporter phosphate-binding protein
MIRSTVRRALAAVASAALALPLVVTSVAPAQAATLPIDGIGSSWSSNAIDQWKGDLSNIYGLTVNYNPDGSTRGRVAFIGGDADFGVSEIPFQTAPPDNENPSRPYAYMPIVAGGTAFMYNLKIGGKRVTNMRLSGEVIAKIFAGAITKWNDPAIQADNPGLAMPDKTITPVVRSDGSGTSAQFSLWMSKQYGNIWTKGMTSIFPTPAGGKAQAGSLGVAGYVSQDYGEGAITYVEYSYALNAGFPVAKVLNKAGYYIEPTANSVAVALLRARLKTDVPATSAEYLTQVLDDVYNSPDARTYPLSSYSYMIVPTAVVPGMKFNEDRGTTLATFARYVLCEGQGKAPQLGYSPLPMNLVLAGSEQIKRIPGSGGTGVDTSKCNNPTFKAGDSPETNQLALSAPQPADCDKQGPNQCTTGTAGAVEETPISGSGTGGQGTGTSAGAGSTAAGGGAGTAGAAGGAADAAAGAVVDETGAVIDDAAAAAGGGAVSSPFTLAPQTWGPPQIMMVVSAFILLAVIVAPALFTRRREKAAGTRRG